MEKTGKLFVVSAPSGTGKTTLCNKLLAENPPGLTKSISATTRKPRRGERQGVDYEYITKKEFASRIKNGQFLECAKVFGNFYGTPKRPVLENIRKGRSVLLSIDVQGAMKIKRIMPPKRAVFIFVMPPSFEELKRRLKRRSTDNAAQIKKRLLVAKREISCINKYDYVILNDRLTKAVGRLKTIIKLES